MRHAGWGVAALGLAGLLIAGCESDTDSGGLASITITDEDEEAVSGNRCAVSGNATNAGNSGRGCGSPTRRRTGRAP